MGNKSRVKQHRAAELGSLTSVALSDMLAAAGWTLAGMHRKQDKVQAILYLEGYDVLPEIVEQIGMERLEPVT